MPVDLHCLTSEVGRRLVEAGFALHDCNGPTAAQALGGVCLIPTAWQSQPEGAGVIVAWAQHDRLAYDAHRYLLYQAIQDELNRTLARVLELLGCQVRPFGQGGASLVVGLADLPDTGKEAMP